MPFTSESTVRVFIHVNPIGEDETLTTADRDVAGTYRVAVSADLLPSQWADAALDAFHACVVIDDESQFEFTVEDAKGTLLTGTPGHRHATLIDAADLV